MQIKQLQIKNFRCFPSLTLLFEKPIVLIEGENGTGKTSLLEAMHYLCYMRSFRTHIPRDLIHFERDSFFIKADIESKDLDFQEIQVGFSGARRLVKLNKRPVQSFKDLMSHYRVVTLTEDDLMLIKGGPDIRRNFVDQALVLLDDEHLMSLRSMRSILDNRNALLIRGAVSKDSYRFWTEQLFNQAVTIQKQRIATLKAMEEKTNHLFQQYFSRLPDMTMRIEYKAKRGLPDKIFSDFLRELPQLQQEEIRLKRSLFGAHLDDYIIHFKGKRSKHYASRGQQKLVMLLLKIAYVQAIIARHGQVIFLLDDLLADFDGQTIEIIIDILKNLGCQLIFTLPTQPSLLKEKLHAHESQHIILSDRKG